MIQLNMEKSVMTEFQMDKLDFVIIFVQIMYQFVEIESKNDEKFAMTEILQIEMDVVLHVLWSQFVEMA